MRCHEVRILCGAWLDSELDTRISFEIEQHLETCADCRRVFEAESKLDRRILASLQQGVKTDALWHTVESRVETGVHRGRGRRLTRYLRPARFAGLAAVVVTVAVVLFWPRNERLDLAIAVAPDHRKHVAGELRPQFDSNPPTEALDQEQGRLDAEAFAKLPVKPGFRSEGKRVCHLSGVPVAWILGRDGELPVSVVVLRRTELGSFPQLRQRLEAGHAVVCVRTGSFQFAARLVGEHVVCAIAATARERLEDLVLTVPASG